MEAKTQFDLPLLLPEIPDERDACVERVIALLSNRPGIDKVHVATDRGTSPVLCLHYDPAVVPLAQVERMARAAGAEVTERYGHEMISLHAVDSEDAARRVEATLGAVNGVLSASVNLAAQRVRVEFDRREASVDQITASLREMGYIVELTGHLAKPADAEHDQEYEAGWYARNKELVWSLTAGVLLAAAWAGSRWLGLPHEFTIGLYLLSYGFGGFDLVRHAVSEGQNLHPLARRPLEDHHDDQRRAAGGTVRRRGGQRCDRQRRVPGLRERGSHPAADAGQRGGDGQPPAAPRRRRA